MILVQFLVELSYPDGKQFSSLIILCVVKSLTFTYHVKVKLLHDVRLCCLYYFVLQVPKVKK